MGTCKDCLHHEACDSAELYNYLGCGKFIDKSEWVHLPCNVGDYVYYINGVENIIGLKVEKVIIRKEWISVITEIGIELHFDGTNYGCAYLTREEAEKALAERK